MANNIIPNTFFKTAKPTGPKIFSIRLVLCNTNQTSNMFKPIAIKMFTTSNSALKETKEVMVPAPAIMGKASGTTATAFVPSELGSSLKNSKFKTSSNPKKKSISEPATANELISIPIKPYMLSPKNKNNTNSNKEIMVVFKG